MKTASTLFASTILALAVCPNADAALINFETIPGVGTPTEGLSINTQFLASAGVSFSLEGGGFPVIAQVGAPQTAFFPDDTPLPGQGTGQFFLTDDGVVVGNPLPLIISYAAPVSQASGVILDIDGEFSSAPEIYTIEARDVSDSVLSSVVISAGDPGAGDQLATPWSFDLGAADIFSIRIVAFRAGNNNVGLAFDNFNTNSAIPEPSTLWLFSAGVLMLFGHALRRRLTK